MGPMLAEAHLQSALKPTTNILHPIMVQIHCKALGSLCSITMLVSILSREQILSSALALAFHLADVLIIVFILTIKQYKGITFEGCHTYEMKVGWMESWIGNKLNSGMLINFLFPSSFCILTTRKLFQKVAN